MKTLHQLFDALARGADDERLTRVVADVRAAGLSGEEAAELARSTESALRMVRANTDATDAGALAEKLALAGLGFVGVPLGDRTDVDGYVPAMLGSALDYDAKRGTELVRTLSAYFDCGSSPAYSSLV